MIEYKDRGLHKINKDKISFSFTKNKNKCVKIGFLFYYVTHTKEYIHNLIINGMKQGDSESINTLYEYYSLALEKHILNNNIIKIDMEAFKLLKIDFKYDFMCRALSHDETISNLSTPLDKFCKKLSNNFKIKYIDKFLLKKRTNDKLTYLDLTNRIKQLENIYFCNEKIKIKKSPVILVVDDVITTGSTANSIVEAIRSYNNNSTVHFISIAQTKKSWDSNDVFFKI